MQKVLFLTLLFLIVSFQYQLYKGHGGITDNQHIKDQINLQQHSNETSIQRNLLLEIKIEELKGSADLLEARSRYELNLVKHNEVLFMLPESAIYYK